MKRRIVKNQAELSNAYEWFKHWIVKGLEQGRPVLIELKHESRTAAQNRLLWAILNDFVAQLDFPRGTNEKRSKEQWKTIFMSAYVNDTSQNVIGISGELVNLSLRTSQLNKTQFSELVEFIWAQGAEWGVKWSDPALNAYDEVVRG